MPLFRIQMIGLLETSLLQNGIKNILQILRLVTFWKNASALSLKMCFGLGLIMFEFADPSFIQDKPQKY